MDELLLLLMLIVFIELSYLVYRTVRQPGRSKQDILLDTSVLIDGRIMEIARSGLLTSCLIVPQSVIRELQFMADKADHDKRERARYGLEVIEKLQQLPGVTVKVLADGTTSEHGVDEQLILLAQRHGAKLCTIDYNLNKAARVQAVEVVNINELAHALRVMHLPGESIDIELVQQGQDKKQAVGYLDDGTMVVVEDGREQIGSSVRVELTRVLQTAAGRMMFARKVSESGAAQSSKSPTPHHSQQAKKPIRKSSPSHSRVAVATTPKRRSAPSQTQTRRRTARTPEDTLVDLANK